MWKKQSSFGTASYNIQNPHGDKIKGYVLDNESDCRLLLMVKHRARHRKRGSQSTLCQQITSSNSQEHNCQLLILTRGNHSNEGA